MSELLIELTGSTRKDIYIWRVRDSSDKCGRKFLAVGECASPEESERIANLVREACESIINGEKP